MNDSLIVKVTPETVGSIKMDLTWELRSGNCTHLLLSLIKHLQLYTLELCHFPGNSFESKESLGKITEFQSLGVDTEKAQST